MLYIGQADDELSIIIFSALWSKANVAVGCPVDPKRSGVFYYSCLGTCDMFNTALYNC